MSCLFEEDDRLLAEYLHLCDQMPSDAEEIGFSRLLRGRIMPISHRRHFEEQIEKSHKPRTVQPKLIGSNRSFLRSLASYLRKI